MKPETSSTSSSSLRRFPVAALAAVAIVGAIEWGFVYPNRNYFREATATLLELKRKAMTADGPPDTIAILGTSKLYHLQPAAIARLMGSRSQVQNYSWAWSGVETYEASLRTLIAGNRIPKIIIVDGMPEVFGYRPEFLSIRDNREYHSRFTSTVSLAAALTTQAGLHDWDSFYQTLEQYAIPPSLSYRDQFKQAVRLAITCRTLLPKPANYNEVVGQWQKAGWFQFAPSYYVATTGDFLKFQKVTGPYKLHNNTYVLEAYERFLDLAHRHNVLVIMVPVPTNPVMHEAFESTGVLENYDNWLNTLEEKYDNFSAPEPQLLNWPENMADPGHLNSAGTRRHMDLVLKILRQHLNP